MSHLTSALEKMSQGIDKLEAALDTRLGAIARQQQELFRQLETERDQNRTATRELDAIIRQMETALKTQTASEGTTDEQ